MSRNLIAILRGIEPDRVVEIGTILIEIGISRIEIPLNSPQPLDSIRKLRNSAPADVVVGAGTVLQVKQVSAVADAGGQLIVSPDCNPGVIEATRAAGLLSYPGIITPSEALRAIRSGASALKLFPAFQMGPDGLAALLAVLPFGSETYAVGGVGPKNFDAWFAAGVTGFGIGSNLFKPEYSTSDVAARARAIVEAFDEAKPT